MSDDDRGVPGLHFLQEIIFFEVMGNADAIDEGKDSNAQDESK